MARLKLDFPEPVIFATELEVRADSINYGGHVGNDRFLSLAQEARIRLFRALGYKNEAGMAGHIGVILTDAALIYKSQLFLGDQLRIEMSLTDMNKYGFDFYYRILNLTSDKLGAVIKTGVIGFDYDIDKICPFPEEFFERLKNIKADQ